MEKHNYDKETVPKTVAGEPVSPLKRIIQFFGTHSCSNFYGILAGIAIISYIIGHYAGIPVCMTAGEWIFFIGILIYLAHFNHRKVFAFLHMNANVSHLPVQQIRLMNTLFLVFFLFLVVLAMAILPVLPYREVITSIGALLLAAVRYIVALIYHPGPQEQATELPAAENIDFSSFFPENTKAPNEILMFLADFLTWAIAVAFFIFVAYQLVCFLYHKIIELKGRRQRIYADTFTTPLVHHEKLSNKKKSDPKLKWNDFSASGKIRKLYRKTIKNALVRRSKNDACTPPLHTLTPSELEQQAGLDRSPQMQKLHEQYEKARYSQEQRPEKNNKRP